MNAKQELLEHIEEISKTIKCATIKFEGDINLPSITINLKSNYSTKEYNDFLDMLNIEYDNGYGSQELFGTIWFTDGTWSDRGEYDGAEFWHYVERPEIPKELI